MHDKKILFSKGWISNNPSLFDVESAQKRLINDYKVNIINISAGEYIPELIDTDVFSSTIKEYCVYLIGYQDDGNPDYWLRAKQFTESGDLICGPFDRPEYSHIHSSYPNGQRFFPKWVTKDHLSINIKSEIDNPTGIISDMISLNFRYLNLIVNHESLINSTNNFYLKELELSKKNVLIMQAAGNDNQHSHANGLVCSLESSDLEVEYKKLCVAALDENYNLSGFSNYGNVQISTFGEDIYSTVPKFFYGSDEIIIVGKSGTSMASPIITGIAGLIWNEFPQLTAQQVRQAIVDGTSGLTVERTILNQAQGEIPVANAYQALLCADKLSNGVTTCLNNPIAHYSFNNINNLGQDETGTSDGVGDGNVVGFPEAIPHNDGYALHVSQDNYIRVPHADSYIPGNDSFTISSQFYAASTDSFSFAGHIELLTIQGGDFGEGVWLGISNPSNPTIRFVINPNAPGVGGQSLTSPITLGQWHDVTGVVDKESNTISLYVDGQLIVQEPISGLGIGSIDPTMDMLIGAYDYTYARNGHKQVDSGDVLIDDLRIYNRVLSVFEIQELYSSLNNGLVAYYPFDGNANDASGNGNDGIGKNITYVAGELGQAANFDGNIGVVNIQENSDFNTLSKTVCSWMRTSVNDSNARGIVSKYISNSHNGFNLFVRFGKVFFFNFSDINNYIRSDVLINGEDVSPFIADNQWHSICVAVDDNSGRLYTDGVKTLEIDWVGTANAPTTNTELNIGDYATTTNNGNFEGELDEVRIYNRALTDSEIYQLYSSLNNGLVAYYPFDGNANDASGHGNHGAEHGGVSYSAGHSGQAASFDGIDSYISVNDSDELDPNGHDFTASFWVKYEPNGSGEHVLVAKHEGGQYDLWSSQIWNDGLVRGRFGEGIDDSSITNWEAISDGFDLSDNKWHFITMRLNWGNSYDFFIDSNKVSSKAVPNNGNFNSDTLLTFGALLFNGLPDYFLKGELDEVRIYNRALTDSEIHQLYSSLNNGLVAYYPFDGNANDASEYGNHGAEHGGVSYISGKLGQAANFDGIDDYIEINHHSSLELNRSLSISYWIKPQYQLGNIYNPNNTAVPVICKNRHTGNNYSSWIDGKELNSVFFQQYPDQTGPKFTFGANYDLLANEYVHVVLVRSESAIKIYVNNELLLEDVADYDAKQKKESLFIGYDGGFGYRTFKGLIDELRIYNRVLSDSEIQELYSGQ